ncbi:hypothetical protein LMG27177_07274 [Paraburkholderia fynbosensis]|uniref:Uncharacterized protein n=1 Tax=Paraburkholderia fynbosensis TaxID=1200993 RepID=A0A6J5H0X1_9BURK|nr:hypothetical protein LMG27177_07274 [Paraburkholderia fynbosensis]
MEDATGVAVVPTGATSPGRARHSGATWPGHAREADLGFDVSVVSRGPPLVLSFMAQEGYWSPFQKNRTFRSIADVSADT